MKRVLIALFAVLAIIGVSSCGGAPKTIDTAGGDAQPTVTVTATPEVTTPAPVVTDTPTPVPQTPTPDSTVLAQYSAWIENFVSVSDNISTAGEAGDLETSAKYMEQAAALAQQGKKLPKTGIPAIDNEWPSCMDDLIKGATLGAQGIHEMDIVKLSTALDYISQASDHLTSITSELQ